MIENPRSNAGWPAVRLARIGSVAGGPGHPASSRAAQGVNERAVDRLLALSLAGEILLDLGLDVLQRKSAGTRRSLIEESLKSLTLAEGLDFFFEIVGE
jgi:hypothetical protein